MKKKYMLPGSVLLFEIGFLILSLECLSKCLPGAAGNIWMLVNCASCATSLAFMILLTVTLMFDTSPLTSGTILLLHMFYITSLALFSTILFWCMNGRPDRRALNIFCNYVQYICSPLLILLYWLYLVAYMDLSSRRISAITWIHSALCVLDIILILSNLASGHIFTVNALGEYVSGSLYPLTLIYPVIGFSSILFMLSVQDLDFRQRAAFLICIMLPLGATIAAMNTSAVALTYVCNVLSVGLLYAVLAADKSRALTLSKAELARQRLSVMASQVQPHFLYNALTAIMSIPGNPPETKEALSEFSSYLRGNLNVLKQNRPIPFRDELTHIRHYLHLEKLRFEEDLEIIYDIQADSFLVPPLAVQMLCENAVKHGISAREEGGTLTLSSREEALEFVVTVTDNGPGFSDEALACRNKNDGRIHVGMDNIESRLRDMVGGSMEVRSEKGKGSEITLRFPKKGQPRRGE